MIQVNIMSYKYGHLVAQAIESVLAQTQRADKIVVIDDGVGDCKHIKGLYDVELIERPENMGIVDNFNKALFETKADRVLFLGADNWLRPDTLEKLSASKADIVSYDIALTGIDAERFGKERGATLENGYYIWRFTHGNISKSNYIHGSSLYDVRKAKSVGGYVGMGGQTSEEDWGLWKRMLQDGYTHEHIAEPMLYYRRHEHNFQKY